LVFVASHVFEVNTLKTWFKEGMQLSLFPVHSTKIASEEQCYQRSDSQHLQPSSLGEFETNHCYQIHFPCAIQSSMLVTIILSFNLTN
jgi:hypothetical protein